MTALGEASIAGKVIFALRLGNIGQLFPRRVRPVERDEFGAIDLISLVPLGESPRSGHLPIGGFRRPNQRLLLPSAGNKADLTAVSTIDIFPPGW
jgi:hypothetical protein